MKSFRIAWEIQLDAETPLEAAAIAQSWIQNKNTEWQYYVQDEETSEIFSVDLQEEDEDAVVPHIYYEPLIVNVP